MTAAAIQVTILVGEFNIDAYQLNLDGKTHLLFTHRQIGEIVGKTKATAQSFLKKHAGVFCTSPRKGGIRNFQKRSKPLYSKQ